MTAEERAEGAWLDLRRSPDRAADIKIIAALLRAHANAALEEMAGITQRLVDAFPFDALSTHSTMARAAWHKTLEGYVDELRTALSRVRGEEGKR